MKKLSILFSILVIYYFFAVAYQNIDLDLNQFLDERIYITVATDMVQNDSWFQANFMEKPYYNKLPSAIWCYKIALMLFNFQDYGFRLIQMLIGFLCVVATISISKIITKNTIISFLSGVFLLTCHKFYDFLIEIKMDTQLLFFQILSLLFLWFWFKDYEKNKIENNKSHLRYYYALAVSICFAGTFFIKTVMVFLVPLIFFVFLIFTKNLKFIKKEIKPILFSISVFLIFCGIFFYYYASVNDIEKIYNILFKAEIEKRALQGMHNKNNYFFYVDTILKGEYFYSIFVLILAVAYSIYFYIKEKSAWLLFVLIWAFTPIIFMSFMQSRLAWYILLSCPAVAILIANFFYKVFSSLINRKRISFKMIGNISLALILAISLYNELVSANNSKNRITYRDPLKQFVYDVKNSKDKNIQIAYNASIMPPKNSVTYVFDNFYLAQIKKNIAYVNFERFVNHINNRSKRYYITTYASIADKEFFKDIKSIVFLPKRRWTKNVLVIFSFDENDKFLYTLNNTKNNKTDVAIKSDGKKIKMPFITKKEGEILVTNKATSPMTCLLEFKKLSTSNLKNELHTSINKRGILLKSPYFKFSMFIKLKDFLNIKSEILSENKNSKLYMNVSCDGDFAKKKILDDLARSQKTITMQKVRGLHKIRQFRVRYKNAVIL